MSLWPDVPSSIFGPDRRFPFSDAHVGYVLRQREDVYAYREGYKQGAIALAELIHAGNGSPALLVWPVAWLWRHWLELALKETIATGIQLEVGDDGWQWPTGLGHRLGNLWQAARPQIEPHGDPMAPELANVTGIIGELDGLDPDGIGFRYPHARDGSPSLPSAPEHLNVGRLDETMQRVAGFLDAVRECQRSAIDSLREQAREAHEHSQW